MWYLHLRVNCRRWYCRHCVEPRREKAYHQAHQGPPGPRQAQGPKGPLSDKVQQAHHTKQASCMPHSGPTAGSRPSQPIVMWWAWAQLFNSHTSLESTSFSKSWISRMVCYWHILKPAYLKHQNFNSDVFFINIFNPKSPRILVHQLLGKLLSWEFLHGQKKVMMCTWHAVCMKAFLLQKNTWYIWW